LGEREGVVFNMAKKLDSYEESLIRLAIPKQLEAKLELLPQPFRQMGDGGIVWGSGIDTFEAAGDLIEVGQVAIGEHWKLTGKESSSDFRDVRRRDQTEKGQQTGDLG
jgi:hypothetical protein